MPIFFDEKTRSFKIETKTSSYIFYINEYGNLIHLYYGKKISDIDVIYLKYTGYIEFHPNLMPENSEISLNSVLQEYSASGVGDYRTNALAIRGKNGCSSTALFYREHRITDGKYKLKGLPSVYDNGLAAQTLDVVMIDPLTHAEVHLLYSVIEEYDAIMRSMMIFNRGEDSFVIEKAASCMVDFSTMDFELLHLHGRWACERQVQREKLTHNIQTISSRRGASGHCHNPFAALLSPDANEDYGDVYGFSLVYSGSFSIEVECDSLNQTRVVAGIHPEDFSWKLAPGEQFTAPEMVMVFSSNGIGETSHVFHSLYHNNLCRGEWKDKKRPILINNWEATYYDFDESKLFKLAQSAAELGMMLLQVLLVSP